MLDEDDNDNERFTSIPFIEVSIFYSQEWKYYGKVIVTV